ncbi:hypothetical protein [Prauserella cavernicola]|uniref:Uncharacterized protein n=1 Tax=Prauserella cavernicola TaxID=2800127 RepID=A0A934V6E2_9PSEU|nr:hypothetical protein [Prauserella cavernicola]MBK1785593.1 hypothetical protein [Prauserella cavernicola]
MDVAALVISIFAFGLALAGFIYARIEFRRTGPLIDVRLMKGGVKNSEGSGFLVDERAEAWIDLPVSNKNHNALAAWTEYSVYGVHVINKGRSRILVRKVYLEQDLTPSKKWAELTADAKGKKNHHVVMKMDHSVEHGGFSHGSELPCSIEGNSDAYWAVSALRLLECNFDHLVNYAIQLGDGTVVRTKKFQIESFSDEEREKVFGNFTSASDEEV